MRLSVLDQSNAVSGRAEGESIRETLALAQHCEALGYDPAYMRQGLMRWKEAVLGGRGKKETRKLLVG